MRRISRRALLKRAGALAAIVALPKAWRSAASPGDPPEEADVVVVGAGAAGLSAALGAIREDPSTSVLVLESGRSYGGTSYRSGGRMWIPNNSDMVAAGLEDPRDMALRYMARLAYPSVYKPSGRWLGLERRHHAQLEAYYDRGSEIMDHYRGAGILPWEAERFHLFPWANDPYGMEGMWHPDYHPELPENVPKGGRTIAPKHFDPSGITRGENLGGPNYGAGLYGSDLIEWLHYGARLAGVAFRYDIRVRDLVTSTDRDGDTHVEGVVAEAATSLGPEMIRASRGVVFAAGGFSKNDAMVARHFSGDRDLTGGGCAVTTAVGDLAGIAERYGFMLELMDEAWFIENIYEQYKKDPDSVLTPNYLVFQAYWLNGDSMIVVNRRGVRVFNEKTNYDDRTRLHFQPDNRFLFSVFDQHTLEHFPGFGGHVTPAMDTIIGPAGSTEELERQLRARMDVDPATAAFGLSSGFGGDLGSTISRFNRFARTGHDRDFRRGETSIDLWWHAFCLTFQGVNANVGGVGVRDCLSANVDENGDPYPNVTMRPLEPPYYAVILSSGLQDTKGGPAIDQHGRILDRRGRPVAGLYGAGNCIASPAGAGYWGAGGTLGPAVVFGHIAGRHAASRVPVLPRT